MLKLFKAKSKQYLKFDRGPASVLKHNQAPCGRPSVRLNHPLLVVGVPRAVNLACICRAANLAVCCRLHGSACRSLAHIEHRTCSPFHTEV
jgi:hypothetical protein